MVGLAVRGVATNAFQEIGFTDTLAETSLGDTMPRHVFSLVLFISVPLMLSIILLFTLPIDNRSTLRENFVRGVPPFEAVGGRTVSYEEFAKFVASRNLTIYLPSWLPKGYSMAAIWARDTSHSLEFPLIIVYSKGNVTDYRAREDNLVVEVVNASPAPLRQYIEDGAAPIYDAHGRLIDVLFRDAYCPTCINRRTLPLAIVRIDGLDYLVSFRDPDTLKRVVLSMRPIAPTADTIHMYVVHSYGNGSLVVATVNRSMLRYLGDGYWLLVLPRMDVITFSSRLVAEITGRFVGARALHAKIYVVFTGDGYRVVERLCINPLETCVPRVTSSILRILRDSGVREAVITFLEGNVIAIDVVAPRGLAVEELADRLLGVAKSYRVVVVERLSLGLPSYFEASCLYEALRRVPCFISAGESFYGIDLWLNITCIENIAKASNRSFDDALSEVINSLKALDPMIRRYLPSQDIVVVVAQPPSPSIDLPTRIKPIKNS